MDGAGARRHDCRRRRLAGAAIRRCRRAGGRAQASHRAAREAVRRPGAARERAPEPAKSPMRATSLAASRCWPRSNTSTVRSTATIRGRSPPTAPASPRDGRFRPGVAGRRLPTFRPPPRRLASHAVGATRRNRRSARSQRRRQVHAHRHGGHAGVADERGSAIRRSDPRAASVRRCVTRSACSRTSCISIPS